MPIFANSLLTVALLCGVPFGAGVVMVMPNRHPIVRRIGIAILVLVLWFAVILLVSLPAGVYSS